MLLLQIPGDVNKIIEEKYVAAKKRGITVQPFLLIAGHIQENPSFFVVIDKHMYVLESALKALDVCFKTFFALNASYPEECRPIWTYIQKHIFDIHTNDDKHFIGVETVRAMLT